MKGPIIERQFEDIVGDGEDQGMNSTQGELICHLPDFTSVGNASNIVINWLDCF